MFQALQSDEKLVRLQGLSKQNGSYSVLVGFLPGTCLGQLTLLANVPGPANT